MRVQTRLWFVTGPMTVAQASRSVEEVAPKATSEGSVRRFLGWLYKKDKRGREKERGLRPSIVSSEKLFRGLSGSHTLRVVLAVICVSLP